MEIGVYSFGNVQRAPMGPSPRQPGRDAMLVRPGSPAASERGRPVRVATWRDAPDVAQQPRSEASGRRAGGAKEHANAEAGLDHGEMTSVEEYKDPESE